MTRRERAKIYPVTVRGREIHTGGALDGMCTAFRIGMVDVESCKRWLVGVYQNERNGSLTSRKVDVRVTDTATGNLIEVLL